MLVNKDNIALSLFDAAYLKKAKQFYSDLGLYLMLELAKNGKIQVFFMALQPLSSTFQSRINFQGLSRKPSVLKYSQILVIRTSIIRNYWVIRRLRTVPTFFSIIYCNKTTYYSNSDYPKKSIFRSDSSVPIEEIAI